MKVVVITGSTRGIGYGLAEAFLRQGCAVVVNGRQPERVDQAVARLAAAADPQRILGVAGDVRDPEAVQALWEAAVRRFGRVDIWVNNAAIENRAAKLWELTPDEIRAVVDANLNGTLYGCRVAIQGMLAQPGGGHIYNMEGMGSEGRVPPGLIVYGTTKRAISHLTKALLAETKGLPVHISTINPGMVVTDMLMSSIPPERRERAKRFFNMVADRVETVAPWLAARMLSNQASGTRIVWLTNLKMMLRMMIGPLRKKRNVFDPEVNPAKSS